MAEYLVHELNKAGTQEAGRRWQEGQEGGVHPDLWLALCGATEHWTHFTQDSEHGQCMECKAVQFTTTEDKDGNRMRWEDPPTPELAMAVAATLLTGLLYEDGQGTALARAATLPERTAALQALNALKVLTGHDDVTYTVNEPWVCQFCGRDFASEPNAARHEGGCLSNPVNSFGTKNMALDIEEAWNRIGARRLRFPHKQHRVWVDGWESTVPGFYHCKSRSSEHDAIAHEGTDTWFLSVSDRHREVMQDTSLTSLVAVDQRFSEFIRDSQSNS